MVPHQKRRLHCVARGIAAAANAAETAVVPAGSPPRWSTRGHETRTATPCGPDGSLSTEQIASYVRDGFLLVSGLIREAVLHRAPARAANSSGVPGVPHGTPWYSVVEEP
jgi:hypothetical protein